jgi:hypothetical protein
MRRLPCWGFIAQRQKRIVRALGMSRERGSAVCRRRRWQKLRRVAWVGCPLATAATTGAGAPEAPEWRPRSDLSGGVRMGE